MVTTSHVTGLEKTLLKVFITMVRLEGNIKVYSCGYQLAAGVGKKL